MVTAKKSTRRYRGKAKIKSNANHPDSWGEIQAKEKMRKFLLELKYAQLYGSKFLFEFSDHEWRVLYSDGPHNAEYARIYGMREHALLGQTGRELLELKGLDDLND